MSKKIRLGYDILSKRAIETESGVNIDEALKKITSYKKVPGTGDDNHPDEPRPSTKVIYIVKVDGASQPDIYKEWIWNQPVDGVGNWECIGGTSDDANSWKRWSEDRGSTGEGESVYLGVNNVANRDETYVIGKNNTTIVNDNTDYTNTDIVDVGSDNTATNAANAYQVGRENTVTGNNLANKEQYPHSMAMNLGRNNTINGEGVNIGKDNSADIFGINIGQHNDASIVSVSMGERQHSKASSFALGFGQESYTPSMELMYLQYNRDYYPIQYYSLVYPSTRSADYSTFHKTTNKPIAVARYMYAENAETNTRRYVPYGNYYSLNVLGDSINGYMDGDTLVAANTAPAGKTIRTYYFCYYTTENESPSESETKNRCFLCTSYGMSTYIDTNYTPSFWTTVSADTTNTYSSAYANMLYDDTYIYSPWTVNGEVSQIVSAIDIVGKEVDGKFIPRFLDNFTSDECVTRRFDLSEVKKRYFSAYALKNLGYAFDDETLNEPLSASTDGSFSIGSMVKANGGAIAIHGEIQSEFDANVEFQQYRYNRYAPGSSSYTTISFYSYKTGFETPYQFANDHRVIAEYGGIGIGAFRDSNRPAKLYVGAGAFGVGDNLRLDSGAIAIGDDMTVSYGAIAIGHGNKDSYVGSGTLLVGSYNKVNNDYGLVLLGHNNIISSGNGILIGKNNTLDNFYGYCFGEANTVNYGSMAFGYDVDVAYGGYGMGWSDVEAAYGGMALGFNGSTAKYGSVSLGFNGANASYGGVAIGFNGSTGSNGGVAIGYNTVNADRGIAIGFSGPAAEGYSIDVGFNGTTARNTSLTFGYNGTYAEYGSLAMGYNSSYAKDGSMVFGFNGVQAEAGSVAIGKNSTRAEGGALALGSYKWAGAGSVAIGYDEGEAPQHTGTLYRFTKYDGSMCYVDIKLGGITYVTATRRYSSNSEYTLVEDPNGIEDAYKTPAGNLYTYTEGRSIPITEYDVYVRAYTDSAGHIIPYETVSPYTLDLMPVNLPDSWIKVSWGNSGVVNTVQQINDVRYCDMFDINKSWGGSVTLGTSVTAVSGSVAVGVGTSNKPSISESVSYTSVVNPANGHWSYNDILSTWYYKAGSTEYVDGVQQRVSFAPYYTYASSNSLALGRGVKATDGSTAVGRFAIADHGSFAIGYGGNTPNSYGTAEGNSVIIAGNASDGADTRGHASSKSIAIGCNDNASNESVSIGDENYANFNSFAYGTKNKVSGWSIAAGVNNTSYDGLGGHATMIGYNNESTSNLEKIKKNIRVKYDKDTARQIELDRYTVAHDKALAFEQQTLSTAEYNKVRTYEEAVYNYYVNGAPQPAYDQSYWDIKNSLVNNPIVQYSSSQWNDWAYYNGDAYEYFTYAIDEYKARGQSRSYIYYRDYAYNHGIAQFLYIMANYAYSHLPYRYYIVLNKLYQELYVRPDIIPMDEFDDPYSDFNKIYKVFYDSYYAYIYGVTYTTGKIQEKQQLDYLEANDEASAALLIIQSIRESGSSGIYIDEVEEVPCSTIELGSGNTSNHYNSILIGANNESLAPEAEKEKTDDDGFTIGIGYHNRVGRNYDIAIGYMSEANGGENVAIQHSIAGNGNKSYHNLAMFDSTALGTGNVAIQNSKIKSGFRNLAMFDSDVSGIGNVGIMESEFIPLEAHDKRNDMTTHNFAVNSKAEYGGSESSNGGFHRNVLFDAHLKSSNTQNVLENFIYGGGGYQTNPYQDEHPIEINAHTGVRQNIILGANPISINLNQCCEANFMVWPEYTTINDLEVVSKNALLYSTLELDVGSYGVLEGNMVFKSGIRGFAAKSVMHNMLFGESAMNLGSTLGTDALHNILLMNSNLVNTGSSRYWAANSDVLSDNIFIGSNGTDVLACVSIADSRPGGELTNVLRSFNFGDNVITNGMENTVLGQQNSIIGASHSTILGNQNYAVSKSVYHSAGIHELFIIGDQNKFTADGTSTKPSRTYILGCQNELYGLMYDNVIIGGSNIVQENEEPTGEANPSARNLIIGHENVMSSKIHDYTILGLDNTLRSNTPVSGGLVQGTYNTVTNGSNIITMGNGNESTGHDSVAIGLQLKSNQWQTVFGKYNAPIDGPDRLTPASDSSQSDKAIFMIGNGYSETDGDDWQDESKIHRSNAMVVYADGTTVFNGTVTAANLPAAPVGDGRYALNCFVADGVATYQWVPVGTTTVI